MNRKCKVDTEREREGTSDMLLLSMSKRARREKEISFSIYYPAYFFVKRARRSYAKLKFFI